jgi:hypothetical protein
MMWLQFQLTNPPTDWLVDKGIGGFGQAII